MKVDVGQAVRLFNGEEFGCLSTLSHGYPFGSLVPVAATPAGNPLIFISLIAEHTKNLQADPRGSVMVTDAFAGEDPNGRARLTIVGRWEAAAKNLYPQAVQLFDSRIPMEIAGNFMIFECSVERIRFISGFAGAGWISPQDWKAKFGD